MLKSLVQGCLEPWQGLDLTVANRRELTIHGPRRYCGFRNGPLQVGKGEASGMQGRGLFRKTKSAETRKGLISSKNLWKIWRKFDFKAWCQSCADSYRNEHENETILMKSYRQGHNSSHLAALGDQMMPRLAARSHGLLHRLIVLSSMDPALRAVWELPAYKTIWPLPDVGTWPAFT